MSGNLIQRQEFGFWFWSVGTRAPQDLRLESTDSAVQAVSRELITIGKRAAP